MKMRGYYQGNQNQSDGHDNFVGKIPNDSKSVEDVLGNKDILDNQSVEGGGYGSKHGLDDGVKDTTWDLLNNM